MFPRQSFKIKWLLPVFFLSPSTNYLLLENVKTALCLRTVKNHKIAFQYFSNK